jgi:hypothetical protein
MAFKAGKPRRYSSRAQCEKIPRPRIHISSTRRADLVTPAPGFPVSASTKDVCPEWNHRRRKRIRSGEKHLRRGVSVDR